MLTDFRFNKEPDFSGILVCTDFDGTLYHHGIAPGNAEAIKYFIDRGGLFTFSTGRDGRWLSAGNLPFTPNVPACCENGAMIFDFRQKEIIRTMPMAPDYPQILEDLIAATPLRRADIVSEKLRIGFNTDDPEDFRRAVAKIDSPVYKLVAYKAVPSEIWVPGEAVRACRGRANLLSNSRNCFEITAPGVDKASGAEYIRKLTGADKLIVVGDCDGDISAFRAADDSFAVGNAIPALKAIAGHVVAPTVSEGAFPEIIWQLALLYGGAS